MKVSVWISENGCYGLETGAADLRLRAPLLERVERPVGGVALHVLHAVLATIREVAL